MLHESNEFERQVGDEIVALDSSLMESRMSMRIAFVTHRFPHVANTFILNEITEVIRMGHEVRVYSLDRPENEAVHDDVLKYDLLNGTRYFLDYVKEDPVNRSTFREHSRDRLDGYLHAFPEIGKRLREDGTQLIHAAFGNRPCTAALALSQVTGLPLTFETHARDLFVDFYMAPEKIARAEKVFTISNYNKRYLVEECGCPENKVVVKRVSIVEDFCDSIGGNEKDPGLLVSVCRLHPIKGIDVALQAMVMIKDTHEHVRLVVIGDGELRGDLEALTDRLEIRSRVEFTGPLNNQNALRYVGRATAFLLPSVIAENGDRDGIPTALVEAMYLQTPGISTAISGIPELIDDGVNGFLLEPGDVMGLAEKTRLLLSNPELRARMGRMAREKVKSHFGGAENTKKVLDVWEEVVGCAKVPGGGTRDRR